jgi:hypothetical protein
MALYSVQTTINKVKILIEEADDTNIITEDQLITAVSDAQKWVAAETGCYTDWGTLTLVADTVRYAPPTDTSGILSLEYDYGGDQGVRNLRRVEPDSVPHAPDENFPYFWYYRGNEISVFPSLTELPADRDSDLSNTVNVLFVKVPAALTTLPGSLVIPDEFQVVVPYHVAKVVAYKDNQFNKAAAFQSEIERLTKVGIAQYAHQASRGTPGSPGGSE